MGYNLAKNKMKKLLIVTAVLFGMMASAMMLSSFTTQKANSKTEFSLKEMGDNWQLKRENVAYCNGDNETCAGTGLIWVNYDTGQFAFSYSRSGAKYDLTYYDGKPGYNYRFYDNGYKYVYFN